MEDPARQKNPFFAYISYTTPHAGSVGSNDETGVPIPRASEGPYWNHLEANNPWPQVEVHYATAVTVVDELVGQIMNTLDETGLSESTIVFFSSDNGGHNEGTHSYKYFASSGPLAGFKRSLKEGGHREPFIVRWQGTVDPGTVSDYQWTFYDFLATAADLAGVDNSTLPVNDGTSLLPTLLGTKQPQKEWVYHEYCQPNEDNKGWGQALRMGDYAGLCIGNKPSSEDDIPVCDSSSFMLYDLSKDIAQENNIASSNTDMVNQMLGIMKKEHTTGDYCTGA